MKRLILRVLGALGLVTAARHEMVVSQLRESQSNAKKLGKLLDEVRAESRGWKLKADEALREVKGLTSEVARQTHRVEKMQADARQSQERWAARQSEFEALQQRLAAAERELAAAREHLMAIEVKLDILEGAATVLDARTRSAAQQQAGESGVPA